MKKIVVGLTLLVSAGAMAWASDGPLEASAGTPIMKDNAACDNAAIWLYDGPNRTGHAICFNEASSIDLGRYCRISQVWYHPGDEYSQRLCIATWAGAVRSYYPGAQEGALSHADGCREAFKAAPLQSLTDASCLAADRLTLR
jgi:hypothetical protein